MPCRGFERQPRCVITEKNNNKKQIWGNFQKTPEVAQLNY